MAHKNEKVGQLVKGTGALPVIASRSTATEKAYCPKRCYDRRYAIKNYIGRIKDQQRIVAHYDSSGVISLLRQPSLVALGRIKL